MGAEEGITVVKIIRVNRCFEHHSEAGRNEQKCPYANTDDFTCDYDGPFDYAPMGVPLDIDGSIPSWCPLEDEYAEWEREVARHDKNVEVKL